MKDTIENKVDVIAKELQELNKTVHKVVSVGLLAGLTYVVSNIQGCINDRHSELAEFNYRPNQTVTLTYVDTNNNGTYDHLRQGDEFFALGGIKDDPIEFSKEKITRDLHEPPFQIVEFEDFREYRNRVE